MVRSKRLATLTSPSADTASEQGPNIRICDRYVITGQCENTCERYHPAD